MIYFPMHVFWQNVRKIIDYREISLKMLASLADVPYSTITNGKNTERQPSIETAYKIGSALNKSIDSLMCDRTQLQIDRAVLHRKKAFRQNEAVLCRKYESVIASLEKLPVGTRESIAHVILTVSERHTESESAAKKSDNKRARRIRH